MRNEEQLAIRVRVLEIEFELSWGLNQVRLNAGEPGADRHTAIDGDGGLQARRLRRREHLHAVRDRGHAVRSEARAQDERSVGERHRVLIVLQSRHLHEQRERELDLVVRLPHPAHPEKPHGVHRRDRLAVDGDPHLTRQRPVRLSELHVDGVGRRGGDGEGRLARERKIRRLRQRQTAILPVQGRAHVVRDPEILVAVEVDAVAEPGEVLHARAGAAPEAVRGGAENLEISRPHGLEIGRHPGVGIHRRQDLVGVDLLVVVRVLAVTGDLEQVPGQLRHVVGVAGLVVDGIPRGVELPRGAEVLVLAVPARHVGVILEDGRQELIGRGEVGLLARSHRPIAIQGADELGDRHVGVHAVQGIAARSNGREQARVIENVSDRQVVGDVRIFVQLVQGVVHASVLLAEDPRFRAGAPA